MEKRGRRKVGAPAPSGADPTGSVGHYSENVDPIMQVSYTRRTLSGQCVNNV